MTWPTGPRPPAQSNSGSTPKRRRPAWRGGNHLGGRSAGLWARTPGATAVRKHTGKREACGIGAFRNVAQRASGQAREFRRQKFDLAEIRMPQADVAEENG